MEIKPTLQPGQNGTKALLRQYGNQLICVRYRYDKIRCKRFKTIELIINEQEWVPETIIPVDKPMNIQVGFGETELREKVKDAGGYWDPAKKTRRLPYKRIMELGLEKRITDEELGL